MSRLDRTDQLISGFQLPVLHLLYVHLHGSQISSPFSIAIGWISLTVNALLSPGITISVPAGNSTSPVTSVVRK